MQVLLLALAHLSLCSLVSAYAAAAAACVSFLPRRLRECNAYTGGWATGDNGKRGSVSLTAVLYTLFDGWCR